MGNEASDRNKIKKKHKNKNEEELNGNASTKVTSEKQYNVDTISYDKNNNNNIKAKALNEDKILWKSNDAIYVFSNSMKQYFPGVIVEMNHEKQEVVMRYWNVQCLEIKYKVRNYGDLTQIKKREYTAECDPWNMPFSDVETLSDHHIQTIKDFFAENANIMNENNLDINEWFVNFKVFLKEKKIIRELNPFMRLISSYLTENVESWIDIFTKYIFTMIVFEHESNNEEHFNTKLQILFNILNVGSEHIDTESLQIICILYAKCMMKNITLQTCSDAGTQNETETKETKQQIAEFADKLLQKITELDDEINFHQFKEMIENSKEMQNIISQSVNDAILTER